MSLKPITCLDETGQRWLIFEEDVAFSAVRTLHLQGVRQLILPRSLLLRGDLTEPHLPDPTKLDPTNPALAPLLRRYIRLSDCTSFLSKRVDTP